MNKALKSALLELKSDGVTLDPIADLDHIIALHNLSLDLLTPLNAPGECLTEPTLKIGGITFRRLSIGARQFLIDVVFDWFPSDVYWQNLAYAYCMATGHEPETIWALQSDRSAFEKAVKTWAKSVGVPFDAMFKAIRSFQDASQREASPTIGPRDYRAALGILHDWRPLPDAYKAGCDAALIADEAEAAQSKANFGPLIEMLLTEYPCEKTGEDWLWRTPAAEIDAILYSRRERQDAEARAEGQTLDSRYMRAHRKFCEYKALITQIKKGSK